MRKNLFIFIFLLHSIAFSQSWTPLGSGVNNSVWALAVYNAELYVGGLFTTAGGINAPYIAKWNGSVWSAPGIFTSSNYMGVKALTVYNNELIAGGWIDTIAGGTIVNNIARWNGSQWAALGSGIHTDLNFSRYVNSLTVYNNFLIAGGYFDTAGNVSARNIAKWNGSEWSSLGSGVSNWVNALAVYNTELYVGGVFTTAGGISASRIAKWNGSEWSPVGSGLNGAVYALYVYNNELYVGGAFTTAGGISANNVAKWNGTSWSPVGSGLNNLVRAIYSYNNELIACGFFTTAGGNTANHIAKYNGTNWMPLGIGLQGNSYALCLYNGNLIVGGEFTMAGGNNASRIAQWGNVTGSGNLSEKLPESVFLSQNYPNPFNPVTKINYAIPKQGFVTLKVYDMLGKEVRTLVNEVKTVGNYTVDFDVRNGGSSVELSSGVFFYRIQVNDFVQVKRMLFIK